MSYAFQDMKALTEPSLDSTMTTASQNFAQV